MHNTFYKQYTDRIFRKVGQSVLGSNERLDELHKTYGWNLTLLSLCNSVKDLEDILKLEFGTIITFLELTKSREEIEYLMNEISKNKLKTK